MNKFILNKKYRGHLMLKTKTIPYHFGFIAMTVLLLNNTNGCGYDKVNMLDEQLSDKKQIVFKYLEVKRYEEYRSSGLKFKNLDETIFASNTVSNSLKDVEYVFRVIPTGGKIYKFYDRYYYEDWFTHPNQWWKKIINKRRLLLMFKNNTNESRRIQFKYVYTKAKTLDPSSETYCLPELDSSKEIEITIENSEDLYGNEMLVIPPHEARQIYYEDDYYCGVGGKILRKEEVCTPGETKEESRPLTESRYFEPCHNVTFTCKDYKWKQTYLFTGRLTSGSKCVKKDPICYDGVHTSNCDGGPKHICEGPGITRTCEDGQYVKVKGYCDCEYIGHQKIRD